MQSFLNVPAIVTSSLHNIDFLRELLTRIGNNDISFGIKAEGERIAEHVNKKFVKPITSCKRSVRGYLVHSRHVDVDAKDASQKVLGDVLTVSTLDVTSLIVVPTSSITHRDIQVSIRTKCQHAGVVIALRMVRRQ